MKVNLTQRDWFGSDMQNKSFKSLKASSARTYCNNNPHHVMRLATPASPVVKSAIVGNPVSSN